MIDRRLALIAGWLASFALPGFVLAQSHAGSPRIGFLGNSTAALEANLVGPFRQRLRELGYEEGRSALIEFRWAEGDYGRFPALVAELLAARVDVIVTAGTPAAMAVKQATSKVPVVMVAVGDPVGTGLVASLARPGGNLTGLSSIAPDLEGKRLELLREIRPGLSRLGILHNPANPFHASSLRHAQTAAAVLKLDVQVLQASSSRDLDAVFDAILRSPPGALLVLADRVYLHERRRIMEFASRQRLPTANAHREMVHAGGLLSYGPSYEEMHRRAADYVDRILKGAKPGDLPIEQPTKFSLLLNLKAAKAMDLTVPLTVVNRADEVIE